jgi:hypothetical protein
MHNAQCTVIPAISKSNSAEPVENPIQRCCFMVINEMVLAAQP